MEKEGAVYRLFFAGMYNGLQKLSIPVFGIVSTMLLAHYALSKPEMGMWSLFLVLTSFVELIRQALVKTSMIKYINHSLRDEHKFVKSSALFLNIAVTLVLFILMMVFSGIISSTLEAPDLRRMIYYFSVGLLLLIPFSHFEWLMYSLSMFKGLFWIYFIRNGINLILIILFLLINGKVSLNWLVVFYNFGILAGMIAGYRILRHEVQEKFVLSRIWLNKMWHFSKIILGSGLSTLIFSNAAQVLLSPLLGSTSYTASQNISIRVINLADMPSQVLSDMLFPKISQRQNSGNKSLVKYYYEKTVGANLFFTIPIVLGILLFPQTIIMVLAGPQYTDAIPYLRIIAITGIFLIFLKHYGVIMDSTGNPAINFFTITIIALVHLAITYFGILHYGFLGAAYALVISHLIGFVITQSILFRKFEISFLNCFVQSFQIYPQVTREIIRRIQWKKI